MKRGKERLGESVFAKETVEEFVAHHQCLHFHTVVFALYVLEYLIRHHHYHGRCRYFVLHHIDIDYGCALPDYQCRADIQRERFVVRRHQSVLLYQKEIDIHTVVFVRHGVQIVTPTIQSLYLFHAKRLFFVKQTAKIT